MFVKALRSRVPADTPDTTLAVSASSMSLRAPLGAGVHCPVVPAFAMLACWFLTPPAIQLSLKPLRREREQAGQDRGCTMGKWGLCLDR